MWLSFYHKVHKESAWCVEFLGKELWRHCQYFTRLFEVTLHAQNTIVCGSQMSRLLKMLSRARKSKV